MNLKFNSLTETQVLEDWCAKGVAASCGTRLRKSLIRDAIRVRQLLRDVVRFVPEVVGILGDAPSSQLVRSHRRGREMGHRGREAAAESGMLWRSVAGS